MPDTDASRLSFPVQLVIQIVSTIIAVVVTVLAAGYGIRSDVRDISTRMEIRATIDDERNKAAAEAIAELKRNLALQAYDFKSMQLDLARAGIPGRKVQVTNE